MLNNRAPKNAVQFVSSVIFLGLSFYIAFFLKLPQGTPRNDLYVIAAIVASYGLWKLWKSVSAWRQP